MKRFAAVVSTLLGLVLQPALAEDVPFSASTFQKSPQGTVQQGKIFVGENRMRTETSAGPQQVVHIINKDLGKKWLLFPGRQAYAEQDVPGMIASDKPKGQVNPCDGVAGAHCQKLGEEQVSGRTAVKWQMTVNQDGRTQSVIQWIDKEREIPLRSQSTAGNRMEMSFIGRETLSGRAAEKWEMSIWDQGQEAPQRSFQWYDPQLNLVIREELPGGFVRELRDIRTGPQPSELFVLPNGWTRVSTPSVTLPGAQ